MSKDKNHDPIVETKICRHCCSYFDITQADVDFYEKISPKFTSNAGLQPNGTDTYTAHIPTPTLCPDCRQRRRLSFRNERKLYRRICDASQQPIISIYKPGSDYTVYDQKIWWSDSRDPMDYGRDFDFTRSFTEQFEELIGKVPHCSILNINSENSDYTNISAYNKDCYLIVESSNNESCQHGYWLQKSDNLIDCAMSNNSHVCYSSIDIDDCYRILYSQYCRSCTDSYCLENCTNCSFCFGCTGLDQKKYRVFNKEVTQDEYKKAVSIYTNGGVEAQELYKKRLQLKSQHNTYTTIRNSQNSEGKYIYDANYIYMSEEIHDASQIRYSKHVRFNSGDCMDVDTVGYNSFGMYECINTALDANKNLFCIRCWSGCNNLIYSFNCDSSSHLFGCIGLRNKSYCIFNKQYTKEEYNILVPKIIEHMKNPPQSPFIKGEVEPERGEFFHPSLSPFGYNETVAQEYFPSTKSDIYTYGYKRSDYEPPAPQSDKVVDGSKLPEYGCKIIHEKKPEYLQDILRYAIRCEVSQKLFRLQSQEIQFYIKHNIPLPRKHPDVRHAERMELRR